MSDSTIPDDEREALLTIAHGAVVTSGGFSVHRLLTTVTEFVLTRGLGPVSYGVYALAWRVSQLLVRLVTVGGMPTLQRYVPGGDGPLRSRVTGLAYGTTLLMGVGFAVVVWVLAGPLDRLALDQPAFRPTMRLFGVLVGLTGLVALTAGLFRATGSARGEVVFNKLLRPAARLAGATGALALGYSVVGVAGAMVACTGLLVVVGVPAAFRSTGISPGLRGVLGEARRYYNHALPVAMSSLGKVFQDRIDLLLVGTLLTAVAAGVYNVVLVVVSIAWLPLLSFNQLLPPVASDLYDEGEMTTLNAVYSAVTRLIVTTVVPLIAVFAVYGRTLLGVFGPTYTAGYLPLVVYLCGVFVGSAVGATGWLLMMTDHQYARMGLDWLLAALNVVLTVVFIRRFGLVGAALGTAVAIAVQNSIQVLLLRQFEGLWPYDRTFLRPLAAGLVMVGVLVAVRELTSGVQGVAVGTGAGLLAYLFALRVMGLDPRDRLVVTTLAGRYRRRLTTLAQ